MDTTVGPSSLLAQVSTLRFPPVPMAAAHNREVFSRLSRMETFNYIVGADAVELVTPPKEGGEVMRIVIGRETVTVALDPFMGSADFAAEQLGAVLRELTGVLPIPVFIHSVHVLRKTMPLVGGAGDRGAEGKAADAPTFILQDVIQIPPARLGGWKRPFASVGVRFVFPPQQVNELSSHELRVESFLQDPAKIFVEDTASFLMPLPVGQWDTLKANLAEANKFVDEYASALLHSAPAQ